MFSENEKEALSDTVPPEYEHKVPHSRIYCPRNSVLIIDHVLKLVILFICRCRLYNRKPSLEVLHVSVLSLISKDIIDCP